MKIAAHIPELDGVRGIAILMVVVYHAFHFSVSPMTGFISRLASYGFAGVDLFFVLSGFLITGILLNAKGQAGYFRNFYARRALRIWPLYYLLLLLSFGVVPLLAIVAHLHSDQAALLSGRNPLVYILLLQNLWYAGSVGPTLLTMTWSLAIEEQFYFAWPWLVLLCSRKKLTYILAAILVLSPLVRLWARLHGVSVDTIYFLTCFRLDGLSLGALVALYCKSPFFSLPRTKWVAVAALAAGVPGSLWLLAGHSKVLWPLLYSVLALASTGAVTFAIWCCQSNSLFGSPFRARWLRYVGQVSYCLYLVHQPIYVFLSGKLVKNHLGTGTSVALSVMVLGFVVSLSIASLSWCLFESQVSKLKSRLEYRRGMDSLAVIRPGQQGGFDLQPSVTVVAAQPNH
jgi:peptidoglycan/LPS O-acetylase OafA/YrhL